MPWNQKRDRLDLAIELGRLDAALEIAKSAKRATCWKQVGDLALMTGHFDVAEQCFTEAKDLSSLFLLYTATSNREGLAKLQSHSEKSGEMNLNFLSSFLLVSQAKTHTCRMTKSPASSASLTPRRSPRPPSSVWHIVRRSCPR